MSYTAGNNVGIKESKGEFLVILNPDTIVKQNWLEELLNAYNTTGEGLYQPKLVILGNEEQINSAGNMIQTFGFGFSLGKGEKDSDKYNIPRKIGFAFVIILLMIALYVILNVNVLNPKFEELTLQSITENISEEELGELADYVSDDSWRLLYDNSYYELLKEDDLMLERIVENVSDADRLILLNDYQINNFYSFIDDN